MTSKVNLPPLITGVEVTSTPQATAANDTYGLGEDIEITVTFSEAVRATGDVEFGISAGGPKQARLKSGSGTTELVFAYTVQSGDEDDNGIWIGNPDHDTIPTFDLQMGQTIVGAVSGLRADLDHDVVGPQDDHKVDGSRTGADATLSSLTLSGITLTPAFAPGTTAYAATTDASLTTVTVTVTIAISQGQNGATGRIAAPDDADRNESGHQVDLDVGDTVITVTVTSSNGASTRTYTITVTRPAGIGVPHDWDLRPPAIATGKTFRLLIVTSDRRNGQSGDVDDYDDHVQDAVDGGHSAIRAHSSGFRALVGTRDGASPRDNTHSNKDSDGPGEQIWWLNGPKAADNYADFYDGDWDHTNPVRFESGDPYTFLGYDNDDPHLRSVWTGARADGRRASTNHLGNDGNAYVGAPYYRDSPLRYENWAWSLNARIRLYGLSPVFLVEAPDAPYATTAAITTDPANGTDYRTGEVVKATVTFSEDVTVTGTPQLPLQIGGEERDADYAAGDSSSTALSFSYTVTDDDTDRDGISIDAFALKLNGGSIKRTDTDVDAALTHTRVLTDDEQLVNLPPLITGVEVTSTPQATNANDTYGLGEDIEITVTFSEAVRATGDVEFGISAGGAKKARLARGNGTTELVFAYTVQAGDEDDNGIWIGHPDHDDNPTFDLQADQSVVGADSGRAALLEHSEAGTQGDHKVDGSLTGADATLSSLTLSGGITLVPAFTPGTTAYAATTSLSSTTVTATASQSGANMDINPDDADTNTTDHDVNLAEGDTVITVTVISTNGDSTRTYTVTVTRQVATDTTAPSVDSATVSEDGTTIDVVFDEPLDETSTPSTTAFLAGISGIQTDRAVPNNVAVSGDTVTLTIRSGNTIAAGAIVTLAYTAPSTNALADASGNEVESFTGTDAIAVLNRPAAPVVTLTPASGKLTAAWTAPANGGSAITGYDVEWKTAAQTWAEAATAGQSATAAADATTHEITGLTNDTEYTVRVRAENDAGDGPWSAEASETPVGAIINVTAEFDADAYTAIEGQGAVTITVTLSTDPGRSVTIPIIVTGNGGADTDDYSLSPTSVTISSGDTSATFTVTATDDDVYDGYGNDDTLTLEFGNPLPSGVSPGAQSAATVGLIDNEILVTSELVPDGTMIGVGFRLLFVTSGEIYPTSSDIDVYNQFVQDAAAGGHADIQDYRSLFRALASTASVSALDNTATRYTSSNLGVPIWWLNGANVADDHRDFYDDSWDQGDPGSNETGSEVDFSPMGQCTNSALVWTGSNSDGEAQNNAELGDSQPTAGLPCQTGNEIESGNVADTFDYPLYGLSFVLRPGVPDGPYVTGVGVTSTPKADPSNDTYGLGEDIEITVTFSEAVEVEGDEVEGDVDFGISVSGPRRAPLKSGSGTTELVFAYTVQSDDTDANGIYIVDHTHSTNPTFDLQGGQSVVGVDSGRDALLEHEGPGHQPDHKVDGSLTTADATLSSLTLSGITLDQTFTAGAAGTATTSFTATTSLSATTVTATATQSGGSSAVVITPADADTNTTGHQVTLAEDADTVITVTVTSTNGNSTRAYTVTVTRGGDRRSPPPPPKNVRAVEEKGGVRLTWQPPDGSAVTGYRIERRRAGEQGNGPQRSHGRPRDHHTLVEDTGSADTGYTDESAEQGVEYEYRVTARNESGPGEASGWVRAGPESASNTPATGSPTITGTAQVGETLTADITSIADADGLSGETFTYQWVSGDGTTDTDIENATGSTYTLVEADQGWSVKVRVTFTDDGGNEETLTSAPTGPVFRDGLPGTPRNLTATAGDREVTLSWEPPDDNGNAPATRYRIEWRIDGKDYDKNHWGTARSTSYTTNDQANLANGVKYFFRVKAENGSGNSYGPYGPASGEVSATPTSGSAVDLGTPVLSDTENLHHRMVRLDWQDIEDAGWYVVQYYNIDGGSGEWLDLPALGVDIAFHGSSAVVSNLHGLSWLRVRAMSCAGESEWSQIEQLFGTNASDWEGVPVPEVAEGDEIEPCPVVLGTPVLSEPENLHHGMVSLDWQDVEDAGWYVVQHYHVKDGEWLDLPAEGVDIAFHGSSAVVSNLDGGLHWLRVGAASCDGESEWSQIEQLFGTKASDWEGVPVPEVAEGDEIEPCSDDADTPDNSPATGAPTISGTARVGETLTADTSGIADADGLSSVQYEYQWLADDADINGATGSTYTLTDSDEGKAAKVRVSFTDDAGNEETLTSAAADAVAAAPTANTPATGAPTINGTAQAGETLTANTSGIADEDGLTNATLIYQWLADDSDISGAANATYILVAADEGKAIKVEVTFTDDAGNDETLTSAATDAVAAAPTPNTPATGVPTISGTAQMGETLTADTSGIADADGLNNVQYEYQWLADDADISGATNTTYTLVAADEGKSIKVEVTFNDDTGNDESLTSAATDAVAAEPTPNNPATGSPTITGTVQVGETLTVNTSGVADADGLSNVQYEHQWLADDTDIAGATNATYTLTDSEESKAITVQVSFTDDADNKETLTSAATGVVAASPAPNSPATGAPAITGTAQVGETLTADTSGIADADGLANATYSFQWLADDTEIAGATSLTYTLVDADEGKAAKVEVTFTDDAGNDESLTSVATDAVAAAEPSEPPTKPRRLSATASHDSVTLTWEDPGDDSITGYVILRRLRYDDPSGHFDELVADTETAAATYADNTVAANTDYTYRIKAINGAGTSERSRWFHIKTQEVPVPDKPTGLSATASHDSVTLTWDDPGDDSITGYVILRRVRVNNTGGDFSELVANTGSAATTYTDATVAASTTYTYRIKAINGAGTSERSRWFHIDTPAAP